MARRAVNLHGGASPLSVHGLFRNESLEAGVRLSLRRAGVSHGEPRTESPSEAAKRDLLTLDAIHRGHLGLRTLQGRKSS